MEDNNTHQWLYYISLTWLHLETYNYNRPLPDLR